MERKEPMAKKQLTFEEQQELDMLAQYKKQKHKNKLRQRRWRLKQKEKKNVNKTSS